MGSALPGLTYLNSPPEVVTHVLKLATGIAHTCGLFTRVDGGGVTIDAVKCWGQNETADARGILGLGDTLAHSAPSGDVLLGANAGVMDLAVGGYHACAILKPNRALKCWGNNGYGQLGLDDLTTNFRGGPPLQAGFGLLGNELPTVKFDPPQQVESVSAGVYHTCAVLADRSLRCWGRNDRGQLGYEDTVHRGDDANTMLATVKAVNLGTGRTVLKVAAGLSHTCALLDNHKIKCWGSNSYGQLGREDEVPNIGDKPGDMGDALDYVKLPP